MILGIDPEFLTYYARLAAGDRIIWNPSMRYLSCFGKEFSGNHDRLVFYAWNGMYELACEFDDQGNSNQKHPVGIQFLCVDGQFLHSVDLLSKCTSDGSLSVQEIWRDALTYLKRGVKHTIMRRPECAQAGHFVRKEKMNVPKEEIIHILKSIKHH